MAIKKGGMLPDLGMGTPPSAPTPKKKAPKGKKKSTKKMK
jgi:hypothetical protein